MPYPLLSRPLSRGLPTLHRSLTSNRFDSEVILNPVPPPRAQIVIAGSGMIGNSVAYHLVENGWKDVLIIDKGNIADGSSKTGSGMLGLFRPKHERRIVQYCIDLYRNLEKQGFDIGLKECGSINLAATKDRLLSLQRRANRYKPTGLRCEVLSPKELKELHPLIFVDDLQGGVWVPEDAVVNPKRVSEVLALLAHRGGAKFVSDCGVERINANLIDESGPSSSNNLKVSSVVTEKGVIECEYFVNCAGIWARNIGKLSDPEVKIPICPAEHFFLKFEPLSELKDIDLPNIRDYDNSIYLRTWGDSFLMGAFEKTSRLWTEFQSTDIVEEHWRHFSPYISAAMKRIPLLRSTSYEKLLNTPDAFTPDGRWIVGEAPEIGNYYVCAGMNGNSLQGAGGIGKVLADWMTKDQPPPDILPFELARFTSLHNNPRFLAERAVEVVGKHYQLEYPLVNEFNKGRRIRTSPIFSELESRGAIFGERMGWERALYFVPHHSPEDPPPTFPKGSFGKPEFFEYIEDEYMICREGVGLIDMSSFAKFIINGSGVVSYLQKLCSNDVDIPTGGIIPTGMLNHYGGYENDCMLIRQGENSFFMISPTQQQTRILHWMANHLPNNNTVGLQDVTSMFTVISVCGPKSKDLVQRLTNTDVNMTPFTYKVCDMGYASGVMVLAVTQTGEPGYSLYIPSEYSIHLYDTIMRVGQDYGIRNVGHLATRFLRIEKFIPFWGEELTAETTPLEVNRVFKVKFDKDYFIGKSALLKQKQTGVTKKLVQFRLSDFDKDVDRWPWGGEAIYRNGEYVGSVTNSAYGFTLKKMVALGFVQHPDTIRGQSTSISHNWLSDRKVQWTINIAGNMEPATIHLHPPQIPVINQDMQRDYKPKQKPGHAPNIQLFEKEES
ncbi:pyruvate dehydrogenase phosphatase regulatory subunit, mitochondrial [Lepeophtheirus salmonis]|uniref:pyruvate dehydrogenase phosphatase regulatory subunit, mitochondrial n=1 Tax=Lepeophtheirus salmonis TaxID=72036 RepID=UPI001AE111E1|nr:pyruvate dehydrogenase phosphatase regulatory subunit, mitochondrial-like [Lepeophtheirus salmonis]